MSRTGTRSAVQRGRWVPIGIDGSICKENIPAQIQVPGWHRKIVQHPSEAIPFGFEGTPQNISDNVGTIGQLYVGKVELKVRLDMGFIRADKCDR